VSKSVITPKLPSPLPSSTETELELPFATAKSGLPSPFRSRSLPRWDLSRSVVGPYPEAPGASAQQHRDRIGAGARHRQVGLAVAVQVADRHGGGFLPCRTRPLPRSFRCRCQQHRNRIGTSVHHRQVGLARPRSGRRSPSRWDCPPCQKSVITPKLPSPLRAAPRPCCKSSLPPPGRACRRRSGHRSPRSRNRPRYRSRSLPRSSRRRCEQHRDRGAVGDRDR